MKLLNYKVYLAMLLALMLSIYEYAKGESFYVEFKDGTKINGIVTDYNPEGQIKIKDNSSNILVFPSENVKSLFTPFLILKLNDGTIEKNGRVNYREDGTIHLKLRNSYDDIISNKDINAIIFYDENANFVNTEYFEFGSTLFDPAGLNTMFGYSFGLIGIRYHGMYWHNDISAHQLNLPIKFYEDENVYHAITPLIGYLRQEVITLTSFGPIDNSYDRTYAGLAYNLNLFGFFIELGGAYRIGNDSRLRYLFSMGYVHRFNDR